MSKKFYVVEEEMITEATRKGSKVKVRAGAGYAQGVERVTLFPRWKCSVVKKESRDE